MSLLDPGTRLLALTLALEESLRLEHWEDAQELFNERDRLIAQFDAEAVPVDVGPIQAVEHRIVELLRRRSADVVDEIRRGLQSRAALKTYHRAN